MAAARDLELAARAGNVLARPFVHGSFSEVFTRLPSVPLTGHFVAALAVRKRR